MNSITYTSATFGVLFILITGCGVSTLDDETAVALDEVLTANPSDRAALAELAAFNHDQDLRIGMLATIEVGDGTITFFESEPGVLGVRAKGDEASSELTDAVGLEQTAFDELYERLRPGEPVPAALIAAQQRADDAHGDFDDGDSAGQYYGGGIGTNSSVEDLGNGIGRTRSALSELSFLYGSGCPGYGHATWCLTNWYNGAWAQRYTHYALFKLAPDIGLIRFRILVSGVEKYDQFVPTSENYIHTYWWDMGNKSVCSTYPVPFPPFVLTTCSSQPRKATIRGEVINASGDRFHYGGAFVDN